ncbi:protein DBF4 homolog A [Odontesthes bonariensis]|uniref:protein DBF4 homolog A n=1 Tax=Odontesthes bonariensis TaxID=219752 RepID=UPI003F58810E
MKPRRTQKHPRPSWQGKSVNTDEKTNVSQAKQTSLVSSSAQVRPFAGKVFYLDLPSNRTAETLESDIKELGGTVEKFFSKEIRYLVSNKREARYVHRLRQDTPVPSPDSGQSSPCPRSNPHRPGNHGDNIKSKSQGKGDTFVSSRGKSLVERVVKEQGRIQMDRILSNAVEWGVKILYIDDVLDYVHKKKKVFSGRVSATAAAATRVKAELVAKKDFQRCKGGRISKPFIKVEDSSRHYRPIYLTMPNMPEFNLKSVAPCSPFCVEDKDPPHTKQQRHRGAKASASEEKAQGRKKNRDKKRGGYCECCMIKYDKLTMHLQSDRHKAFSKTDEYAVVDGLVSTLHCDFINIKTKVHRPKCSVSSVLVAPGPCGKIDLEHKGDLDPSETVKLKEQRTDDGSDGLYPGQNIKMGSASGSYPPSQRKTDRRTFYTYSHRSKHKPPLRKRTCGQICVTACTQTAERPRIPQLRSETAPSGGEFLPWFPSKMKRGDHISQKDPSSSSSYSHNVIKEEHVDINKNTSVFEAVQERSPFSEKVAGNDLPEKDETSFPVQSFSPVRKIQRRVRVYKHKRRKVDTNEEQVKPRDVSDNSILNLWELFKSSDDTDVEFHGFADQ